MSAPVPPLPDPLGEWRAQPHWRAIDLISDIHLHPARPRTFEAWRAHLLHSPAQAVLILGDLFEVWVGDDARDEPFAQQCLAVLRAAATRRVVAFMAGNRDFLVGDALLADCGVQRLDDPCVLVAWGRRVLLSHGDALCVADVEYQQFRLQVRSPAWQQAFLAQALDERHRLAQAMRDASAAHQAQQGPSQWADVDAALAKAWLSHAEAAALVHGHTHRPGVHRLPAGGQRHVLGDWDFDAAVPRGRILRLDPGGLHPVDLARA